MSGIRNLETRISSPAAGKTSLLTPSAPSLKPRAPRGSARTRKPLRQPPFRPTSRPHRPKRAAPSSQRAIGIFGRGAPLQLAHRSPTLLGGDSEARSCKGRRRLGKGSDIILRGRG